MRPNSNIKKVTLAWTASIDNSEVRYEIWRRFYPSGTWQLLHTTDYNETEYMDSLSAEGKYEYRIRAIDIVGQMSDFSTSLLVELKSEPPLIPLIPPTEDFLLLIIIIASVAAGICIVVIVAKKRSGTKKEKKSKVKKYLSWKDDFEQYGDLIEEKKRTEGQEPLKKYTKSEKKETKEEKLEEKGKDS